MNCPVCPALFLCLPALYKVTKLAQVTYLRKLLAVVNLLLVHDLCEGEVIKAKAHHDAAPHVKKLEKAKHHKGGREYLLKFLTKHRYLLEPADDLCAPSVEHAMKGSPGEMYHVQEVESECWGQLSQDVGGIKQ